MINEDDPDWETTATGRKYSYKYGYGVLDGYKYFKAAQSWKLVKPQSWLQTKTIQHNNGTFGIEKQYLGGDFIPPTGIESKLTITKELMEQNNLESLEHINVRVWIGHATRGEVEVEIVSPNGIRSVLGAARASDKNGDGYPGWMFMSVKHWYDNPFQKLIIGMLNIVTGEKTQLVIGCSRLKTKKILCQTVHSLAGT